MGLSVVEIYNQALSLCGTRAAVSSTTERSREAEICTQWYATVRDQVLRAAHWQSCRKQANLTLLASRSSGAWTSSDPISPWTYAYALPADYLHPRYLDGFGRFEIARHGEALALLSDIEDASLIYTMKETNTSFYDIALTTAIFTGLAGVIVNPLTGSGTKSRWLLQMANDKIVDARVADANDDQAQLDTIPDWLSARGISGPTNPGRYLYPYGPAFAISGSSA